MTTQKAQLKEEDVKKLADLAKIEITIAENEQYLKDINNILGHLSMVNNFSSASDVARSSDLLFYNNTRKDGESRDFKKELILKNIPNKSTDNYVKVAKVINKSK